MNTIATYWVTKCLIAKAPQIMSRSLVPPSDNARVYISCQVLSLCLVEGKQKSEAFIHPYHLHNSCLPLYEILPLKNCNQTASQSSHLMCKSSLKFCSSLMIACLYSMSILVHSFRHNLPLSIL